MSPFFLCLFYKKYITLIKNIFVYFDKSLFFYKFAQYLINLLFNNTYALYNKDM